MGVTDPSKVSLTLQGKGSPAGTVSCKVWNAGGSVVATSGDTISASSIPTSATNYSFDFSDSLTMTDGYHIGIECSGSNDSNNSVGVKSYSVRDESTIVTFAYNDGSWQTTNSKNCSFYIEGT